MPIEQHPFVTDRWFQQINNPLLMDKWFINRNNLNEISSFAYMPNKDVKSIFLGTFPIWEIVNGPIGNNNIEFFYGSVVNDFWPCLGNIVNLEVNNINNRFTLLNNLEIGITDILKIVKRNPANCNADNCLTAINYNDILDLKKHFPKLENIFLTSGGKGPIGNINNNRNAATWLKDSLLGNQFQGFNNNAFIKNIFNDNLNLNLIYLYSPAGQANIAIQRVLNNNNNFGIQNITINHFRRLQWGYFIKECHFGEFNDNEAIENIWNEVINNHALLDFFEV